MLTATMWAIVQHVSYDGEGNVGRALRRAGRPWVRVRPFAGEPLPRAADLSGLVVLGAPAGSADDRAAAHLVAERQLIAEAVGLRVPVLGVCFGAQLLAVALSGGVTADGVPEIGMGAAVLTGAGRADPVLGPGGQELTVLHWHRHGTDCRRVRFDWRRAARTPSRRFASTTNVYGLKFHVEINRELADVIADQLPEGALEPAAVACASAWGETVLDRFLALS